MNLKTFEAFRSLLEQTLSADDETALTCIRQANKVLLADNKTWHDLLAGKVNVVISILEHPNRVQGPDTKTAGEKEADDTIEEWFQEVLTGNISSSFRSFIDSLYTYWGERGYLTPAQTAALKEAYERATRPKSFSGKR